MHDLDCQWRTGLLLTVALVCACAPTITEKDRAAARIFHDLGVASLNNGDRRGALRELLQAVERDPTLPEAHHALALVFQGMGRMDDALLHYEKAVALRPAFSAAQNNMGTLLIAMGRYDEAISAFRVALSDILYPTPALAEANMGWATFKKGDVDTAIKHLRNAVAVSPKLCRGYERLMRIGLDRSRSDLVINNGKRFLKHCAEDEQTAATIAPEYVRELTYYLGLGYLEKGDLRAARDSFRRCASDSDDAPFAARCASSLSALQ